MLLALFLTAGLAAALLGWSLVFVVVDRAVILKQLILAGVVELALLAQVVVAGVGVAGGRQVMDPVTLWGYLFVALLLLPVAGAVAFAERSRWSSVVLAVAVFTIMVMEVRVWQVWTA